MYAVGPCEISGSGGLRGRSPQATNGKASAIAAIHVPTLVAVGDRDLICTPDDARALSARIEGSQFHMLRSCGHLAPMERPGEVTALLRQWLKTG